MADAQDDAWRRTAAALACDWSGQPVRFDTLEDMTSDMMRYGMLEAQECLKKRILQHVGWHGHPQQSRHVGHDAKGIGSCFGHKPQNALLLRGWREGHSEVS